MFSEKTICDFTPHLPKGAIRGETALAWAGRQGKEALDVEVDEFQAFDMIIPYEIDFKRNLSRHCGLNAGYYGKDVKAGEQQDCLYMN